LDGHPFLARRTFRRFLERWPDHPRAAEARATAERLEATIPQLLGEVGLTGDDAAEVSALHEEVHSLLTQGKYHQAREVAGRLRPAPAPRTGAGAGARGPRPPRPPPPPPRCPRLPPPPPPPLRPPPRSRSRGGRPAGPRQYAERLRAVHSAFPDSWAKKAEAL